MAGEATKVIIVAQAEGGNALQEGVVVDEQLVEEELHEAGVETHATTEEHSEVFPPFDGSTFGTQLLWLALTFIFLYVVLSRIALPRIGGILESRKARIDGDLKEADRLRQETDRALEAYEAALAEARANAHAIAEETRSGIRADIEMKRKSVETDLSKKLAGAEARIGETKTAALGNVDAIATDTLRTLMERLTGPVTEEQAREAVATAGTGERS
jgi:F-type H+-transporting ATPase subunit b